MSQSLEVAGQVLAWADGHFTAVPDRVPDGVVPGRVCAHTHLYSGLAPLGMPAPEPPPHNFVQILERVWWRLDRALSADTLRASARLYVAEALLAGTTTLIDHHESPNFIEGSLDVLADACEALGVRAVLCYGATDRNGGPEEGARGLAECRRMSQRQSERVRALVGLHASFTVSDQTIRDAAALCDELGLPMHVHVAEDGADVRDAIERGYAGPLERLAGLGALPPGSIIAHGIHLSPEQIEPAESRGWWFVQNPRSNLGNDVGYPLALSATDRVALGTDGYPGDMRIELAEGRTIAAEAGDDPDRIDERLEAGHRLAAGLFREPLGVIEPGFAADFCVQRDGEVNTVVVAGQVVVRDGQLLTGDLPEIRREAQAAATELWAAMRAL